MSNIMLVSYYSTARRLALVNFFTADSVSYFKEYLTDKVFSVTLELPQKIWYLPDESPVKIKEVHDWLTLHNEAQSVSDTSIQ